MEYNKNKNTIKIEISLDDLDKKIAHRFQSGYKGMDDDMRHWDDLYDIIQEELSEVVMDIREMYDDTLNSHKNDIEDLEEKNYNLFSFRP